MTDIIIYAADNRFRMRKPQQNLHETLFRRGDRGKYRVISAAFTNRILERPREGKDAQIVLMSVIIHAFREESPARHDGF